MTPLHIFSVPELLRTKKFELESKMAMQFSPRLSRSVEAKGDTNLLEIGTLKASSQEINTILLTFVLLM